MDIEIRMNWPGDTDVTPARLGALIGQRVIVKRHNGTHPWKAEIRHVARDHQRDTLTLTLHLLDTQPPDPHGWVLCQPLHIPEPLPHNTTSDQHKTTP